MGLYIRHRNKKFNLHNGLEKLHKFWKKVYRSNPTYESDVDVLCIMNSCLQDKLNDWYYVKILKHVKENIRRWSCKETIHGSSTMTVSDLALLFICDFLTKTNTTVVSQLALLTWPSSSRLFLISQIVVQFDRKIILANWRHTDKHRRTYVQSKMTRLFPEMTVP